jgi:hypothetical protein
MLRVSGHAHQGGKTPGIAESQRGQVDDNQSAVAIDDIPDVADGNLGAGDIKFAAEAHDGLASGTDPVAQLQQHRSFQVILCRRGHFLDGSCFSNVREHPGLRSSAIADSMHVSRVWGLTRQRVRPQTQNAAPRPTIVPSDPLL